MCTRRSFILGSLSALAGCNILPTDVQVPTKLYSLRPKNQFPADLPTVPLAAGGRAADGRGGHRHLPYRAQP